MTTKVISIDTREKDVLSPLTLEEVQLLNKMNDLVLKHNLNIRFENGVRVVVRGKKEFQVYVR